mmetsp:Transcript_12870/g.16302  ORF Transcript_12870/g.16302 Transcript_12870/m.16302 type:complete len:80 (+) Transcript_12870:1375-1614(+)
MEQREKNDDHAEGLAEVRLVVAQARPNHLDRQEIITRDRDRIHKQTEDEVQGHKAGGDTKELTNENNMSYLSPLQCSIT